MRSLRMLGIALSIVLTTASCGPALAQAGISNAESIPTSDAATQLLQPLDSMKDGKLVQELSANGIDSGVPEWPGTIFNAEGGPLRIFNCTGNTISVKTYNSNDIAVAIEYQKKSIGNGSAVGLKCATKSCKVRIGNGNVYSALSGPQVLLAGAKLQATNSAAISGGCGVYVKPK